MGINATRQNLKSGDLISIYNMSISGKLVIEGQAKLKEFIAKYEDGERWYVWFEDEIYAVERFIHY